MQRYAAGGTELSLYQRGREDCAPGHSYGPAVRDHYLVHYISSGRGIFRVNGDTRELRAGQGFLICPDVISYYEADGDGPWSYAWVGFNGARAEEILRGAGLGSDAPVFTCSDPRRMERCLEDMLAVGPRDKGGELLLLSQLYRFLAILQSCSHGGGPAAGEGGQAGAYADKAAEFVRMNYSRKISVEDIAAHVGLDRSYLCSLFRDRTGMPLRQYLMCYRMNRACELLSNPELGVGDVARSVGYDDQLLFSKTFKRIKGVTPSGYREGDGGCR